MPLVSRVILAFVRSSILLATTILARRTERSPSSSLSTNTTNHGVTPHVDDTSQFSRQATSLLEDDLEANYNTLAQSLPHPKKESWWNIFLRFLVHLWPNSFVLRLLFLSRILLLFLQRGVNLFLPYLIYVFLERNFELSGIQRSSEDAVLQALHTYLFFRVLEKSLGVLQRSL
jgi:hypothetical protein